MENPIVSLLEMKQARQSGRSFAAKAFFMFAGTVLSLLFYTALVTGVRSLAELGDTAYHLLLVLIWPLGAAVLVGGPLQQLQRDAGEHISFLQGRCYDELLGTQMTAREIVDGMARYSAQESVKTLWRGALGFFALMGLLLPGCAATLLVYAALWAPVTYILTWASSYLAQQLAIWNTQLRSSQMGSLTDAAAGALTGIPAFFTLIGTVSSLAVTIPYRESLWVPSVCLSGYLLVTAGLARWLALAGLERLPHLHRKLEQVGKNALGAYRNPWVRPFSDNPVVARETYREAGRTPFGLLGFLAYRHIVVLGCVLSLLCFYPKNQHQAESLYYMAWFLLGGTLWFLASRRTATAVVSEREQKTLSSLATTRLGSQEFIDGWLWVGARMRVFQSLVIGVLMVPVGLQAKVEPLLILLQCLTLMTAPLAGSAMGFYASLGENRKAASHRFATIVLVTGALFFFMLAAMPAFQSPAFMLLFFWLYLVLTATTFREMAAGELRTR